MVLLEVDKGQAKVTLKGQADIVVGEILIGIHHTYKRLQAHDEELAAAFTEILKEEVNNGRLFTGVKPN